jgi:formylglycine-generating enzyme required for sulfatase activity
MTSLRIIPALLCVFVLHHFGCSGPPSNPVPGQAWNDPISGIEFCYCPPGSFQMGLAESIPRQSALVAPLHAVTISKGFWMGREPVSVAQWGGLMGTHPSGTEQVATPVIMVSWYDCDVFLRRLNGLAQREVYRLPTEAEWEYACDAGEPLPAFHELGVDGFAEKYDPWHRSKEPNAWGLSDMLGLRQWCSDWRGPYTKEAIRDPQGPATGTYRINRGGDSGFSDHYVHPAYRWYYTPDFKDDDLGFRVVRVAD